MKVSARIAGRVTSISIRDSLCAMHYLLACENKSKTVQDHINDLVAGSVLNQWKEPNAKGLSAFVQDCIVQDVLHEEDLPEYVNILNQICTR